MPENYEEATQTFSKCNRLTRRNLQRATITKTSKAPQDLKEAKRFFPEFFPLDEKTALEQTGERLVTRDAMVISWLKLFGARL